MKSSLNKIGLTMWNTIQLLKLHLRRSFLVCLLLISFNAIGLSQSAGLSGLWVLTETQTLSGPRYVNGLPKQMKITSAGDSISIVRLYDGGTNDDYTISESLPLNGLPVVVIRSVSKRQSTLKPSSLPNEFSVEVTYRDMNTGKQTSADFIENWQLFDSDGKLTIEKHAKDPDGSNWALKGIYERRLNEDKATGKGIQFVKDLNWADVKALAKKENKSIFVDCFATWCIPCKKMEKEVFALDRVGEKIRENFIGLRVQIDTSKNDNDEVRKWYETAHQMFSDYRITAFPTYLFFDPGGNIVHKAIGYMEPDDFLSVTEDATNPEKQYFTLLNKYRGGSKDYSRLDYLILAAKKIGENKLAEDLAMDYRKNFTDRLHPDSLLSEKYLTLAFQFPSVFIYSNGTAGSYFQLLYHKPDKVDRILSAPGYSLYNVSSIITQEEINDKVYKNGKPIADPNWKQYKSAISSRYGKVDADLLVTDAQLVYYEKVKNRKKQVQSLVAKVEKYGPLKLGQPDGSGSDNVIARTLLLYCEDMKILNRAVGWMEQIIKSDAYKYPIAMVYGNYGALLYKAGRTQEGIAKVEECLKARGYTEEQKDSKYLKPTADLLERMKRGEKIDSTWKVTGFF